MNLLIVEDSERMRRMLRDLLVDLPLRITCAADPDAAVEEARRTRPELVLMDILLPERDGIDLAQQFLGEGWTRHVYMVTECRERRYREAASAAGAEEYFLKDNLLKVRHAVEDFLAAGVNTK